MPSRRHSSAMLSSPRKPVSTMRIFSSAENCRRVARRISFTTCSAGCFTGPDFCPICAPSIATMGQKSSLPQLTRSVSVVLMPDMLNWIKLEVGSDTQEPPDLNGDGHFQHWLRLVTPDHAYREADAIGEVI